MVSIISEWLQKRMPSYSVIEEKLTKEQVENNKDITKNLQVNLVGLSLYLIILYVMIKFMNDIFNGWIIYLLEISLIINIISVILAVILPNFFCYFKI